MGDENDKDNKNIDRNDLKSISAEALAKIKAEIEADIKKTEDSLVSDKVKVEIADAAQKAKEQAKIEFEQSKIKEDQDTKIEELKEQLKQKEKDSHEKINALKEKVDGMVSSKAVYNKEDNPFRRNIKDEIDVNMMSQEELAKIEQESLRIFLDKKSVNN